MNFRSYISLTLVFSFLLSLFAFAPPSHAVPKVDAATAQKRRVTIHRQLLSIYKAQNRTPDAMKEYPILLKLTPNDARLRYEYGLYLAKTGNDSGALTQLKKASSMDPSNADIYGAIGTIMIKKKNFKEGCTWIGKAISAGGDTKKYKEMYDKARKYVEYEQKRVQYEKRRKEYQKKLEQRRKAQEAKANGEKDDDDW